jgi:uncharacterized delta-60 repeat protein
LEDRLTPSTGGLLDPTFGSGGVVTTAPLTGSFWIHTQGGAGTVQSDGKVVVVGSTYMANSVNSGYIDLVRYNTNGTLDTGFGSGGVVSTKFNNRLTATGLALDPTTGKIVVVGEESGAIHLVRYNTNGTLDKTFGSKGDVLVSFSQGTFGQGSIVVESVGGVSKLLVCGNVGGSYDTAWAMARFNLDGTLDTGFGTGGRVVDDLSPNAGGNSDSINGVALRSDGTVLVVGTAMTTVQTPLGPDSEPELVLAHYDSAGRRDLTFGSGGTAVLLVGTATLGQSLALRPDGKIFVAANSWGRGSANDELLARFNADGSLDSTFAGGGYFTTYVDADQSYYNFNSVALQSDGNILFGHVTPTNPVLLRYHGDGTPDASFGSGGLVSLPINAEVQTGPLLLPDGRVVVTGSANNTLGAARYLMAAPQVGSFTASPNPVASGSLVTLMAGGITDGNPNSTVTQVAFYYLDGTGTQQVLGYGTADGHGNWTLNYAVSLPPGSYTVYAQATDNYGALGDPLALTLQVM